MQIRTLLWILLVVNLPLLSTTEHCSDILITYKWRIDMLTLMFSYLYWFSVQALNFTSWVGSVSSYSSSHTKTTSGTSAFRNSFESSLIPLEFNKQLSCAAPNYSQVNLKNVSLVTFTFKGPFPEWVNTFLSVPWALLAIRNLFSSFATHRLRTKLILFSLQASKNTLRQYDES